MAESFRNIAEALLSDHPESFLAVFTRWPSVKVSRCVNVSVILATPKQQAEPVSGYLAAAL
jgi:hypothetical protein